MSKYCPSLFLIDFLQRRCLLQYSRRADCITLSFPYKTKTLSASTHGNITNSQTSPILGSGPFAIQMQNWHNAESSANDLNLYNR